MKTPRYLAVSGRWYCEPDDVLLSREIHPTIIGAESFHCPVRDGKEWFQLAMVVRQNLRPRDCNRTAVTFERSKSEEARPRKVAVAMLEPRLTFEEAARL